MARKGFFGRILDAIGLGKGGRHRSGTSVRDLTERLQGESTAPPPVAPPIVPAEPSVDIPRLPGLDDQVARSIANDTVSLGVDSDPSLVIDIDNLIGDFGGTAAVAITHQQNESSRAYSLGDDTLGNERFVDQVAYLESLTGKRIVFEWMRTRRNGTVRIARDYVQWFYYHATRRM